MDEMSADCYAENICHVHFQLQQQTKYFNRNSFSTMAQWQRSRTISQGQKFKSLFFLNTCQGMELMPSDCQPGTMPLSYGTELNQNHIQNY